MSKLGEDLSPSATVVGGKVMFLQACIIPSVHRGGACMTGGVHGGVHGGGACVAGRDMHGRGYAWQGACMAGGGHALDFQLFSCKTLNKRKTK